MSLDAEPLDCDPDDDYAKVALIQWYERRGYKVTSGYDHLEKAL